MFRNIQDLLEYIALHDHTETRECEFKAGMPWEDLKLKIVKASLGLTNLEGGGYVIIGVPKNQTINRYEPVGMTEEMARTYKQDDVSTFVNLHAQPYVTVELKDFLGDSRYFIVIQISEFDEVPVICSKGTAETIAGRIYCRTHRRVESSPEPTVADMKEIIDLAVDKGIRRQRGRVESYGFPIDTDPFEHERGDF